MARIQHINEILIVNEIKNFWESFHHHEPAGVIFEVDLLNKFEFDLIKDMRLANKSVHYISLISANNHFHTELNPETDIDFVVDPVREFERIPHILRNIYLNKYITGDSNLN